MRPPSPIQPAPRLRPAALAALAAALAACGGGESGDAASQPPGQAGPDRSGGQRATAAPELRFTDQAAARGLTDVVWCGSALERKRSILESIGQGAAWLDDDGDGRLDLFLVNGSTLDELPVTARGGAPPPVDLYYADRGPDAPFEEVGAIAGLADDAWGNGVAAADMDNDGDTDLFVTCFGPHRLHENLGRGDDGVARFRDVAAAAGVDCAPRDEGNGDGDGERRWGTGAAWGDVDADGFLDLYVCHYLVYDPENPPNGGRSVTWQGIRDAYYGPQGCIPQADRLFWNAGDGTFVDATATSGVGAQPPAYSLGVLFTDGDADGDADLYVANDSQPNYYFENDGSGRFSERAKLYGLAFGDQGNPQAGMGLDAADWNGDGRDDLVVTNFDGDVNTLYENRGRGFRDVTVGAGLAAPTRNRLSWGVGWFDFDHDGDLDLFVANGHVYPRAETDRPASGYAQPNQLFLTEGRRLIDRSERAGPAFALRAVSRGVAFGDCDADGDVDALVSNLNAAPSLYRNDSTGLGAWLGVRLVGTRSNRDGIGARVTVRADKRSFSRERRAGSSFLSTNSPWLHFGLGTAERVESIEVRWPSGAVTRHGPLDARARVVLREDE